MGIRNRFENFGERVTGMSAPMTLGDFRKAAHDNSYFFEDEVALCMAEALVANSRRAWRQSVIVESVADVVAKGMFLYAGPRDEPKVGRKNN